MAVEIPVKTKLVDGGKGFDDAEKAARRAANEATRLAREQERAARSAAAAQDKAIRDQVRALNYRDQLMRNSLRAEEQGRKRLADLTGKLDKDLAGKKGASLKDQIRDAVGSQLIAAEALQTILGGVRDFTVESVAAAKESIAAEKELGAVLNSTGQAAGGYKQQLQELASHLQDTTNFSDEAVQHSEAVLLTFTKIGRDIMPQAVDAVTDLAELMGGDLQAASVQVGKALNDPIKGIGALTRVGVSFTEQQKEQIKAMVEAGDVAGAQRLILAELNKEFGGQAEAAREAAGGTQDLIVSFGEFQESVGKLLLSIGDTGLTGMLAGLFNELGKGADAWQGVIDKVNLLDRGMDKLNRGTWLEKLEQIPVVGNAIEGLDFWGSAIFRSEEMEQAMSEAGQEMEAAKAAAEAHAQALIDNTEATEENAAAQADLEKKLEAANKARRNFAGELIDITEQATADTQATWDDYFKEEQGAWSDYQENVAKIQADSAKEQERIQKDLAKTLADIDKNLGKDLAKLDKDFARDKAKVERDAAKQISRMQQDAAREERRAQRQRQIDTRADQRLFQYDMRQLAAEGEFNQIQQAMERRAIEQQIAAEKTAEEDRQRREDSRLEIERARQDTRDRLAEMEEERNLRREELMQRAEEERQAAQERAAEEETRRQEELAQALAEEEANYQERMEALRQHRDEKLQAIEEGKEEAIAKLVEQYIEEQELTREQANELLSIAEEMGPEIGGAFAEGINSAFERQLRIDQMLDGVGSSTTDAGSTTQLGSSSVRRNPDAPYRSTPTKGIYGFASGGEFTVGGAGGVDSQLVQFMATPGERVIVQPAGQSSQIVVNVNGPGGAELAAIIRRHVEQGVQEYHDKYITPWSNG